LESLSFLLLAVTLDLYHRKVIDWSMGRWITRKLVIDALNMTIKNRCIDSRLIHHSGRGVHYTSNEFQALLKTNGIQPNMNRKRDCGDNATAESFFHTLKVEKIHGKTYNTKKLRWIFFNMIEGFYNRQLRCSYLGYLSPDEHEKKNTVQVIFHCYRKDHFKRGEKQLWSKVILLTLIISQT
jgi:putative transposase